MLQDETLTSEQRKEFEAHAASLSGVLLSSWLPYGTSRRLLMVGIIILGIYGLFVENYQVFVWWLLLPAFSPRIMGEAAHFWGVITKKNPNNQDKMPEVPSDKEIAIYGLVSDEIKNNNMEKGLWAKAIADTDGHEAKTKALYIKYRVQFLIDSVNSGDYYFFDND